MIYSMLTYYFSLVGHVPEHAYDGLHLHGLVCAIVGVGVAPPVPAAAQLYIHMWENDRYK